jgi:hypothetical protein
VNELEIAITTPYTADIAKILAIICAEKCRAANENAINEAVPPEAG